MSGLQPLDQSPASLFDVALLDLDGVVYRGAAAVDHAPDSIAAVRAAGMGVMYVTNNANRPPSTVAAHLTEIGVPTTAADVTTAAQAAAGLVASEYPAGTRVLVVGGAGLREALTAEGLVPVESADDAPAVVVQGFAPDVGWAQLTEAVLAISAGAEHVASNLDATLPMERGSALGNGSLVAAVVNATGRRPRSTGKPRPEIFLQAASRAGASRPIVVGDRLDTDLEGARAAGYPGMHVLTGVDLGGALLACVPEQRPTQLAHDLRGLLEPHPAVEREGDRWRCRAARAWFDATAGAVCLERNGTEVPLTHGTEIELDELRAACAAAWRAADEAGAPTLLNVHPQIRVTRPGGGTGAIA
ncbi:HAD-IIA family hydrolase [Pseudactinotalea sp.]|uniref:HAD-IIA family hydrolase n=1 Tax=Pseudactinotalea sp. TaxID=1926260 RepID=UPI003B3B96F0